MSLSDLQLIRVSPDCVVVKRGAAELFLEGGAVGAIVEPVVELLRRGVSREEIESSLPPEVLSEVEELLDMLARRRLIGDATSPAPDGVNALQSAFWGHFGPAGESAPELLEQAVVTVIGANQITRSLVRSLLEMGVGRVVLIGHPILDNEVVPFVQSDVPASLRDRLDRRTEMPAESELAESTILCASCDLGEPNALLEVGRLALRLEKPYLPVWLVDLRGMIGPLVYPFQTACLRCFRARSDSQLPNPQAAHEVRAHMTGYREARACAGLIPPMTGVVGEIAAMELAKSVGSFAPADAAGRVIEINLVSFGAVSRRVLKVPRCPECGETMRHGATTQIAGFLLPYSDGSQ